MSALVRWNPAYSGRRWRHVAPRHLGRFTPYWDTRVAMPLDIEENEDVFVIKASVPGFAPEDLKIEIEDGVLTIRAEHEGADEQEHGEWYLRERVAGTLERKLKLGKNINSESIEATLEHGVLTLTLSKVEAAKPRLISVKTA